MWQTEHLKPLNSEIDELYVVQKCCSPDSEASKLRVILSGKVIGSNYLYYLVFFVLIKTMGKGLIGLIIFLSPFYLEKDVVKECSKKVQNLTKHFTVSESQSFLIDLLYAVQKRQSDLVRTMIEKNL